MYVAAYTVMYVHTKLYTHTHTHTHAGDQKIKVIVVNNATRPNKGRHVLVTRAPV